MTKCVVVDAYLHESPNAPMSEMENLLASLDITIDVVCSQNLTKISTSIYMGTGLLKELAQYVKENGLALVVFNNDLTPLQIKNITDAVDVPVYDRSMIILKIFEKRAYSREAKLQVEVAYLKYMASRLIEKDKNYAQVTSGGAGGLTNRGAGEKAIDIKRYLLKKRIKEKEDELEKLVVTRQNQRRGRSTLPVVAIVGYTNAGKSTLMNHFIRMSDSSKKEEVLQEDRLFATLSTTTRLIKTKNAYPFLLTDTVGFISDLPTPLIKAFRSTLEEIKDADLLIHVVDISSDNFKEEIKVTKDTLSEIGVKDKPVIYLYNKVDQLKENYLPMPNEDELFVSLKDDTYMEQILNVIETKISANMLEVGMVIPYESSETYFELRNSYGLRDVEEKEDGYHLTALLPHSAFKKYRNYLFSGTSVK